MTETRTGGSGKDLIGKGAFGNVRLAKENGTENLFAIKAVIAYTLLFHRSKKKYSKNIRPSPT